MLLISNHPKLNNVLVYYLPNLVLIYHDDIQLIHLINY